MTLCYLTQARFAGFCKCPSRKEFQLYNLKVLSIQPLSLRDIIMLDSTYYVLLTLSPLGFTRHQLPHCWLFWLIKVSVISLAKWFQGAQWSKSFVYNIWSFTWVQKNNNAKVISIYVNTKVARKGWEGLKILCSPSWVSQWGQSNDCHVTLIDPHSPIQSGLTTAERNPHGLHQLFDFHRVEGGLKPSTLWGGQRWRPTKDGRKTQHCMKDIDHWCPFSICMLK